MITQLTDAQVFVIRSAMLSELSHLNQAARKEDITPLQTKNIASNMEIVTSVLEALSK